MREKRANDAGPSCASAELGFDLNSRMVPAIPFLKDGRKRMRIPEVLRWTRSRSLSQMKWKLSFAADIAILGIGRVVEVSGKANRPQARPIPRYRVTILFSLPSLSTLFFSRGSVFAAALTGYESTPHRTGFARARTSLIQLGFTCPTNTNQFLQSSSSSKAGSIAVPSASL